jgi:uncharacterized protein YbjT (DUF2867 family)
LRIVVAGGSGFVGGRLVKLLSTMLAQNAEAHVITPNSSSSLSVTYYSDHHHPSSFTSSSSVARVAALSPSSSASNLICNEIICLSRNPESLKDKMPKGVSLVRADVQDYESLVRAMKKKNEVAVDVAYYLIHSMEGSSKEWRKFAERDRMAAENFAKASNECGVKRVIYLGGLTYAKDNELSEHMKSRKEVGEILRRGAQNVTIFRAAVILGQGGGSFQMLQYLVERLPIMICPKWVLTKCQPISVDDVVRYLAEAAFSGETRSRTFDIGGPEILTYLDMIHAYAKIINKNVRVIVVPFLTPRLSSYWVDLVTPVKASLARPLVDSLIHDATVKDGGTIQTIIPMKLKSFEDAIKDSLKERMEAKARLSKSAKKERTSRKINNRILTVSLLFLAVIGLTYYILDPRRDEILLQPQWLMLSITWYLWIAFSIYFVRYGTRLGAFSAGTLGWITLAFFLLDNLLHVVFGKSSITLALDPMMTILNFLGEIVASMVIASSHNVFHKLSQ